MTTTEYLIGFIIAAVLTPVIILGGMTMAYFLDKHRADPPKAGMSRPTSGTAEAEGNQSTRDIVETFAPLGSSLAAGSQLRPDPENDSPSISQSKELATSTSGGNSNARR